MRRRYAVVGDPIRQSLSPWLHARFARVTQRDIVYAALKPAHGFAACADEFFAGGGGGLNITVPYKAEALQYAGEASALARRCGAANVLTRRADGIAAHNTDGGGFLRAAAPFLPAGFAGRKVLLLGAGGAARAVAFAVADEQPAALWIMNRTPSRAQELADAVGGVFARDYPDGADIVINATSAALRGEDAPLPPPAVFAAAAFACDLSYGAAARSFLQGAAAGGAAQTADGGAMLAWQAALSFALWEGVLPPVAAVLPLPQAV